MYVVRSDTPGDETRTVYAGRDRLSASNAAAFEEARGYITTIEQLDYTQGERLWIAFQLYRHRAQGRA